MYKKRLQMELSDFIFPYGDLDPNNDWVRICGMIPWDDIEDMYAKQFENTGNPAHSARRALGSLIIKQMLGCSDVLTVKHISENPYLQYFIGEKEYTSKCPFCSSSMANFRKRFSATDIAAIIDMTIPRDDNENDSGSEGNVSDEVAEVIHNERTNDSEENIEENFAPDSEKSDIATSDEDEENSTQEETKTSEMRQNPTTNAGKLLIDATCCPADIIYPQDIKLLNNAREKLEGIVDELCESYKISKPRTRRKQARRDYLNFVKKKRRGLTEVKKAIGRQLKYVGSDISFVADIIRKGANVSEKQADALNLITTVYEQQRIMYEEGTKSVPNRIVSLSQPWVRPIVRGKVTGNTEFGAKLHISVVKGYSRIERIDFDPYHEGKELPKAIERYREFWGYYPERVLADKAYRSRENLDYCRERGIKLSGPPLGRPRKDAQLSKEAKEQEYIDSCERNEVEGKFGTGKTSYGLARIAARLEESSKTVVAMGVLCGNLVKRLKGLLRPIFEWLMGQVILGCWINTGAC